MKGLTEAVKSVMEIDGAVGVAIGDYNSGMALASEGGGTTLNLEVACAGNAEVIKAKNRVKADLRIKDKIEDIMITLDSQYHLLRPIEHTESLFFYVVLNRSRANLAMARHRLATIEKAVIAE